MADATFGPKVYKHSNGDRLVAASGGSIDVESGGEIDIESGGALKLAGTSVTATAAELNKLDGLSATSYPVVVAGVSFTEASAATSYTATVEIPAGAIVHDIGFVTTVLWNGTSASLDIGDDDDPNGWFAAFDLKATDLVVGEVLSITNSENWGAKQGVYLVAATGRKGRVTAGVDSGVYYGAASEVIFRVTPGAADGTAGRSFGWVVYSVPTFVAAVGV